MACVVGVRDGTALGDSVGIEVFDCSLSFDAVGGSLLSISMNSTGGSVGVAVFRCFDFEVG